ncbi:40S ribosomal protein S8-B [Cucumispora dikerogammari]|nr:40S ribosomal protein S8-B [Cucumispora dikerogammari]
MGITRSNAHKRKPSGARKGIHEKKRKHNLGRAPSNTRIGEPKIKAVRTRGGNQKMRALRTNIGNFAIKSSREIKRVGIEKVLYHPSDNKLVRMNLLTKSAIVKLNPESFQNFKIAEDEHFNVNLEKGLLYGRITSRPGQCGTIEGYILQADELQFYENKFLKKRGVKKE